MPQVGVRELKRRASEILRDVSQRRARYTVTSRGRPVGLLVPFDEAKEAEAEANAAWERFFAFEKEFARRPPPAVDTAELLSSMRR